MIGTKDKSISFMKTTSDLYNQLGVVYEKQDVTVLAAIGRDRGTLERKLVFAIANCGEVSPLQEFAFSKCPKTLSRLLDFSGIDSQNDVDEIWANLQQRQKNGTLKTICLGSEKGSITEVHRELSEYVCRYKEEGKVFVKDTYGYIESSYLPKVINRLGLGYSRLELLKNFKACGLLRTNGSGAAHEYTYKINRDWFVAFQLLKEGGEEE